MRAPADGRSLLPKRITKAYGDVMHVTKPPTAVIGGIDQGVRTQVLHGGGNDGPRPVLPTGIQNEAEVIRHRRHGIASDHKVEKMLTAVSACLRR